MNKNSADRAAIVTGGTGALGRVIVNKFADEGLKVYVPSLSIDEFKTVFDSDSEKDSEYFKMRKIYCFECDATNEESVIEFVHNVSVQEKGKIDYLINTVGGISTSEVIDLTSEALNKMIDLNFKSAFFFTKEVLKTMKNKSFGRIISIGAIAGLETTPGKFAYSFSKSGVINLMNTISEEMKETNIRCNCIIPSILDTPANREWGTPEEIKKWVRPEEVAGIIYDLVSDGFSSVRGSSIKVYGSY